MAEIRGDISGEITSHLAALGAGTRDRRVFAILTRDPHFIEDEPVTGPGGEVRIDITNTMDGVLLRFRGGELDSVRTTARRDDDYYPYPRPTDLITGLDLSTATREDVDAVLGDPLLEGPEDVRYQVGGGVLTVGFEADQLVSITVTRD